VTHLTEAQREEARNDLILADIALKQEQLRTMKAFEGWRFVFQAMTAGAAVFGSGAAVGGLLIALLLRHP
jgi:hypothetical protein